VESRVPESHLVSVTLQSHEMAPGKPVHSIKIRVSRHNAQKIGAKLNGEVESQARAQDVRTDTYQPNSESAAALNQAIVCFFSAATVPSPHL
jgi:hypothetical protein